jgi:hypothetical protein
MEDEGNLGIYIAKIKGTEEIWGPEMRDDLDVWNKDKPREEDGWIHLVRGTDCWWLIG